MAEERLFTVQIISPARVFYEGQVTMLELNTSEGELGIYRGHIPLTAVLVPGIVTLTGPEEVKKAAVHAGFIEILPDQATILAEIAEWPEEIDVNRAQEAKVRAERMLKMGDQNINLTRAKLALRRSLTRLELTKK